MANAKIILDQTDAGGVKAVETVQQMINTAATDTDSTYTDQDYFNQYDPANNNYLANYNSIAAYFEATLNTSAGTGYAILSNDTDGATITGSEVTTTNTSYERARSGDIFTNLPTAAKDMDTQLRNSATNTTSASNSWLIIQNNNTLPNGTSDSTLNANNGNVNGASWQTECKFFNCLDFDGSNDYVLVTDDASLDFAETDDFTITGWFKHIEQTSGTDVIIAKYETTGADGGYKVQMEADGDITFAVDDDNTFEPDDAATSTLATYDDNSWHHFAAVKDGTTSITLYIDAAQVAQDASIAATATLVNDDSLYIGIDGDGTSNPFDGSLDEMKIYPYVRTADEIKTDFIQGAGAHGSSSSLGLSTDDRLKDGLVGHWPLDEQALDSCGTNTDACDSSGNSHDLIAVNEATTVSTPGVFGNAATFDGTGDYYCTDPDDDDICEDVVNNGLDFSDTDDFSISLWFYRDTFNTEDTLVSKANHLTSSAGYILLVTSFDDVINFRVNDGTDSCQVWNNTSFTTSAWNHLTVTFDQDDIRNFKIFVNGIDDTVGTSCTQSQLEDIGGLENNYSFAMGALSTSSAAHFGDVDGVRVYNRALSPAEVQDLYEWAPGPVAYYPFDEGTGTSSVYDRSGNGNTGTMQGSMTESDWVAGKYGQALEFDGSDDRIQVANSSSITLNTAFTVSMWIKTNSVKSQVFISMDDFSSGWEVQTTGSYEMLYYLKGAASNINKSGSFPNQEWHYLTVTFDSSIDNYAKYYLDGNLQSVTNGTAKNGVSLSTSDDLFIGSRAGTSTYVDGAIDEVRLYNYVRTAEQVVEDMNAGHPAPGSPVGSPIGHWKFDEGYGDTANDAGTGGNNFDLGGSTTCPTASECPTWNNSGKISKALYFDGSQNDDGDVHARLPNDVFDSHTEGSISLWFNPDDTGDNNQVLFSAAEDDDDAFTDFVSIVYEIAGDNINVGIRNNNASPSDIDADSVAIDTSTWHHVVLTMQSSGNMLYIDGESQALTYTSGDTSTNVWFDDISENTTAYTIGCQDPDGSNDNDCNAGALYEGYMDEVKVYNFALTADQIKVEYNQGSAQVFGATSTDESVNPSWSSLNEYCPPGQGSSCTAPVGEWLFNEKTGSSAQDTSENANTGTISGATWRHAGACHKGSCLEFGGADAVDIDGIVNDINGSAGSWTAWIYRTFDDDTPASKTALYIQDDSSNNTELFYRQSSDVWEFDYDAGGIDEEIQLSPNTIPKNTWTHVGLTWSSANDEVIVYINGDNTATSTGLGTWNGNGIGSACLSGILTPCDQQEWVGMIDQVRVYDYTRSPAQIAWEYNHGAPIGWWKFDDNVTSEGDTVYDSSGNGNNGTLYGDDGSGDNGTGMDCNVSGQRNTACDFDGTDDYIDSSYAPVFSSTDNFSVSLWFKYSTTGLVGLFSAFADTGTEDELINFATDSGTDCTLNYFKLAVRDTDSTSADFVCGDSEYADGNWHHAVGVYDRTNTTMYLYIDGVQINSSSITANSNGAKDFTGYPLYVGAVNNKGTAGFFFDGQIDDVRIYNYALTQQQINDIYNFGAVRFGS
jgi:hypothetical protein